jgi:DNA-binding NarL/FixJ family response regulator
MEEWILEILKPDEWSVVRVPDNRAALSVLKEKSFDVAFIRMSEEASQEEKEALRMIREMQPDGRLLVLDGNSTSADVLAFLPQGSASSLVERSSSGSGEEM